MATKTTITKQEEAQTEHGVQLRTSDPGSPVSNQLWITKPNNKLAFYNGSTQVIGQNPSRIFARYIRTTNQSISNTTQTIVDFDTVDVDTNSAVTTGASWHFTAPTTRDHLVVASITWATNSAGANFNMYLFVNGSSVAQEHFAKDTAGIPGFYNMTINITLALTASDTVDVRVDQDTGGSLDLQANMSKIAIKAL